MGNKAIWEITLYHQCGQDRFRDDSFLYRDSDLDKLYGAGQLNSPNHFKYMIRLARDFKLELDHFSTNDTIRFSLLLDEDPVDKKISYTIALIRIASVIKQILDRDFKPALFQLHSRDVADTIEEFFTLRTHEFNAFDRGFATIPMTDAVSGRVSLYRNRNDSWDFEIGEDGKLTNREGLLPFTDILTFQIHFQRAYKDKDCFVTRNLDSLIHEFRDTTSWAWNFGSANGATMIFYHTWNREEITFKLSMKGITSHAEIPEFWDKASAQFIDWMDYLRKEEVTEGNRKVHYFDEEKIGPTIDDLIERVKNHTWQLGDTYVELMRTDTQKIVISLINEIPKDTHYVGRKET